MAMGSIADLRRLQAQEEGETTSRERMLAALESASALRAYPGQPRRGSSLRLGNYDR